MRADLAVGKLHFSDMDDETLALFTVNQELNCPLLSWGLFVVVVFGGSVFFLFFFSFHFFRYGDMGSDYEAKVGLKLKTFLPSVLRFRLHRLSPSEPVTF